MACVQPWSALVQPGQKGTQSIGYMNCRVVCHEQVVVGIVSDLPVGARVAIRPEASIWLQGYFCI
jgi:hypothetical protein